MNTADLVNLLRRQGAEIHRANAAFKSGSVEVAAGDYIIRMDQPYSTVVDTLLDVQVYPAANPRPYDDTGWTMPPLRNVKAHQGDRQVDPGKADDADDGRRRRAGHDRRHRARRLIIDHTTDNSLMTFRFANKDVKMQAAEEDFEAAGRKFTSGAFIVPNADRAKLEAVDQGIRPVGVCGRHRADREDARSRCATHRLRALMGQHAERRLGAHRVRSLQGAVHLFRR